MKRLLLLFLAAIPLCAEPVVSLLQPSSPTFDTYPVTTTQYQLAGWMNWMTNASQLTDTSPATGGLPMSRRKTGMISSIAGVDYRLSADLTTWTDVTPVTINQTSPFFNLGTSSDFNAFGDSITSGANAISTNYTFGVGGPILPQYRWPYLIANSFGRTLNLTYNSLGGTSHSFNSQSDQIGRRTPFNRFGTVMSNTWSGYVTLMIGYNDLPFMANNAPYDQYLQIAQSAFIARALIDGYAGVGASGLDSSGVAWPSWTSTGTTQTDPYTDCVPFTYGNPGTDQRLRNELVGSQIATLSLTNKEAVGIFFDTSASGGLVYVYTNGASAGVVNTQFALTNGFGSGSFPMVLWMTNLPSPVEIGITNASGTNQLLGVGWIDSGSTNIARRVIVAGSMTKSPPEGPPYSKEQRNGSATVRAATGFSSYPVYFANVFDRMVTDSDNQIGDLAHLTPLGNSHVAEAFESAVKVFPSSQQGAAMWRASVDKADRYGAKLNQIDGAITKRFWVGTNDSSPTMEFNVWAPAGGTANLGLTRGGPVDSGLRWQWRMVTTAETGANAGSDLQLVMKSDAGGSIGVPWQVWRADGRSTYAYQVTNQQAVTMLGDLRMNAAAPKVRLDATGTKQLLFQTNSVDASKLEGEANGTYVRMVMTDISGTAANVPQYWHRGGGVTFPNQVTNQSTLFQQGYATIGSTTTAGAQVTMVAQNSGEANRILYAIGTTNRAAVELPTYNIFRVNLKDTAGSALWNAFSADITNRVLTVGSGATFITNSAATIVESILTTKQELRVDTTNSLGDTGPIYLQNQATNFIKIAANTNLFTVVGYSNNAVVGTMISGNMTNYDVSAGLGNLVVSTIGKGLQIKEGTNAKMGVSAAMTAGSIVISTTAVTANSRIFLTPQTLGTVLRPAAVGVTARTAGTSFTITSSDATDTSTVAWMLVEPSP